MPAPTALAEVKAEEEAAIAAGCEKRRVRGLCLAGGMQFSERRCGEKACFSKAQEHAARFLFAEEGAAGRPERVRRGKKSFRTGSQGAVMRPHPFFREHMDELLR